MLMRSFHIGNLRDNDNDLNKGAEDTADIPSLVGASRFCGAGSSSKQFRMAIAVLLCTEYVFT